MNSILDQPTEYTFNHLTANDYERLSFSYPHFRFHVIRNLNVYGLIEVSDTRNYLCLR